MKNGAKTVAAAPPADVFDPTSDDKFDGSSLNGRREIERREALPVRWPTTPVERRAAIKWWRRIAMQIVANDRLSFRLMAVLPDFINQQTGELWPTNETLAIEGGHCAVRTIKREVALYQDAGLLIADVNWRRNRAGKLVKSRTLRLAVPTSLEGVVEVPGDDFRGDNRGPHEWDAADRIRGDNRGPKRGDNRGPFTLEGTIEGSSGDVAA